MTEEDKVTRCEGCGKVIDPSYCWCGDHVERHFDHPPVPYGCTCYRDFSYEEGENE